MRRTVVDASSFDWVNFLRDSSLLPPDPRRSSSEHSPHSDLVGAKAVHCHHVTLRQFGREELLDIGAECLAGYGAIQHHGCDNARAAQTSDEGRRNLHRAEVSAQEHADHMPQLASRVGSVATWPAAVVELLQPNFRNIGGQPDNLPLHTGQPFLHPGGAFIDTAQKDQG